MGCSWWLSSLQPGMICNHHHESHITHQATQFTQHSVRNQCRAVATGQVQFVQGTRSRNNVTQGYRTTVC